MGQVTLVNLRKSFDSVEVIRGIDLEVKDGEFVVFVGPSGCGKSTTLRMIAGLEKITSGDLLIDGVRANDLHPSDRGAAMVFQSYALYPHMNVADNMGFALKMAGVSSADRKQQVGRAAEILRMSSLLDRFPKELSGGQRQRVAIGRAIVRKPKVFLFDEPLSNLDAALRVEMRIELARLHKELGSTMIYVTHDQVEAMTLGDRIMVFNKGSVEQSGPPLQLYNKPETEFVAGFIGAPKINFVDRPTSDALPEHRKLWNDLLSNMDCAPSRTGVRPEHISIVQDGSGIPATVEMAEHLGDSSIVHLRVNGVENLLTAKVGANSTHAVAGQAVSIHIEQKYVLPFDENGLACTSVTGSM